MAYKLNYIDKVRVAGEASDALKLGSAVHGALEALIRDAIKRARKTKQDAELDVVFARELFTSAAAVENLKNPLSIAEGLSMMRCFVEDQEFVGRGSVIAVEKEFNLPLSCGIMLNGYIDRVDRETARSVIVYDYKTNKRAFTQDELNHDLQLTLYSAASKFLWKSKESRLSYWMLRLRKQQDVIRTDREIKDAIRLVNGVAKQIVETEKYEPSASDDACRWCDFARVCPAAEREFGKGYF